jgi:endonuclease/exonuclease/phosphatase family metal-dependent hydrolase
LLAVAVWNSNVGGGDLMAFVRDELGLRCSDSASALGPGTLHFALLLQEAFRRSPDIPPAPAQWAIPPPVGEEPREGPRLDVVEVAERCGLALVYVAAARNGDAPRDGMREDKGVAILSTLPLSDIIAIELPYEAARRVAVAATINGTDGDSLRLVSAHLISTPPPSRVLTTGNASRLRQALAVVDVLHQAELARGVDPSGGSRISTVVAGDLNTWSQRETSLRHLREHFPDSPAPLEEGTRGPFPTDHLLFRRADDPNSPALIHGSYLRIGSSYNSDHHPLIARFGFGGIERQGGSH